MSVNNVGNPQNRDVLMRIIPQQGRTETGTVHVNADNCTSNISPDVYRQYLSNHYTRTDTQIPTFVSSLVNGSEEDMQAVYEIDREAFSGLDPYDSYDDFKSFVENEHLSTFAVKDENGNIIGYYQLEPVKGTDLYIDSIGLKSDYRNSMKGYIAIGQCWDEIQQYARDNGAQTLSLHADATNRSLIRFYTRLGFNVSQTLPNYYDNGADAYFMTKTLAMPAETVQETETEVIPNVELEETLSVEPPQTLEQEPVPEEAESVEERLIRQYQEAFDRRVKEGIAEIKEIAPEANPYCVGELVRVCGYKENNRMFFSEDMFSILKVVAECSKISSCATDYDKIHIISSDKFKNTFTEINEDGNRVVRTDLTPYIRKFVSNGIHTTDLDAYFRMGLMLCPDGKERISKEALDACIEVAENIKLFSNNSYYRNDGYSCFRFKNKDGSEYVNKAALSAFQDALINKYDPDNALMMVTQAKFSDLEGNEYFDKDYFQRISKLFGENWLSEQDRDNIFGKYTHLSIFSVSRMVKDDGTSVKECLNAYRKVNSDSDIVAICDKFDKASDVGLSSYSSSGNGKLTESDIKRKNINAVIKAVNSEVIREKEIGFMEYKLVKEPQFDAAAFNCIKEQCADPENFKFDSICFLANIVDACKAQKDAYSGYVFSQELFDKALQLKSAGVQDSEIPEIIEACKLGVRAERYNFRSKDIEKYTYKEFNDDIYNTVYEYIKSPNSVRTHLVDAVLGSIEVVSGEEKFNHQVFDILKNRHYCPRNSSSTKIGWDAFFIKGQNGDRKMDVRLLKKFIDSGAALETISDKFDGEYNANYKPNEDKIDAYNKLKSRGEIPYTKRIDDGWSSSSPIDVLMDVVTEDLGYPVTRFSPTMFERLIDLLDKDYDGRDAWDILSNSKEYHKFNEHNVLLFNQSRYDLIMKLLDEGIDIVNAGDITRNCVTGSRVDQKKLSLCKELYSLGDKRPCISYACCCDGKNHDLGLNEAAYTRWKESMSLGFTNKLIENCKDRYEFRDDIYQKAMTLYERGFAPANIENLMELCHTVCVNPEDGTNGKISIFDKDIYCHIEDLENIGINQENVFDILEACSYNYHQNFSEEAFSKVSDLKKRGFDDKGIATFIRRTKTEELKGIDAEKYENLIWLTARHNDLKDSGHNDTYVIEKISNNMQAIMTAYEVFGSDVMNYAISSKIDNYVLFANHCAKIKSGCSESFVTNLQKRLSELPSPELKVKRLRIIGSLSGNVDENALNTLKNMIKSPKMTQEQVNLANEIFTTDEPYEAQVEKFIREIHTPQNTQNIVREYLMKERLDKKINVPKSIEEQLALKEKFAQLTFTNPAITVDKKIEYIDTYRAQIADMKANPEKYTKPRLFDKPMANLAKVVEAYINIPNDDMKFEQSIQESMYQKYGIETNADLLGAIHYDARYFDKLFAMPADVAENFKRLIGLKKTNPYMHLTDLRMTLPEEGSAEYNELNSKGLIAQIKANLDTKRKMVENGLDFDKWNKYDKDLFGETFTVEADPETEYKNLIFNVFNVFQDDLWGKMNKAETDKLIEYLKRSGFTFFNNRVYKSGKELDNKEIESFVDAVISYTSSNKYFSERLDENGQAVSETEIEGINGFSDHIKSYKNRIQEIKGARTVKDIHFRLSDEDDIGRNIFFGNHVGCCNSIESSYAGYSAPMHLLNAYNRGIELVDNYGNSFGNSRCFFALVDGKLTFIIDSFEANGKLASNPIVTENLLKFAKDVCAYMGRPDAQVVVGPKYNNMSMEGLTESPGHTIKILGTICAKTYCDSLGGHVFEHFSDEHYDRTFNFQV